MLQPKSLFKIICSCTVLIINLLFLSSCFYSPSEKAYYRNRENYITVTGTIEYLEYNDDRTALYISFTDLSEKLDDNCFKIVGENLSVVRDNGFEDLVKVNDKVTFITAPKYFGDGYVMPIVSISLDDICFLDFTTGYENFIKTLE